MQSGSADGPIDVNAAKSMAIQNTDETADDTTSIMTSEEKGLKPKEKMKNPFGPYSYVVLALLFLIRLADQQQQQALGYIYGFVG